MKVKISSKTMNTIIKATEDFSKAVIQVVKRHPAEVATGIVGTGLAVDDIYQHCVNGKQRKASEEREQMTAETLKKHEAEIQTLKAEADKAHDLEIINEQLCDVIREQKETTESEKVHEDGTAD